MAYLCLRVDLDYVPWDTPDAEEFGHGEPALIVRMLELARHTGYKYHVFASERVLRAFPAVVEAILNDGHDLDWLCKHPEDFDARYAEASRNFGRYGHRASGLAVRDEWPSDLAGLVLPSELTFLSALPGACPRGLRLFPVETLNDRETFRSGQSPRRWMETIRTTLREVASLDQGATLVVRPQVLAKHDPKLSHYREMCDLGLAVGLKVRTLRDLMAGTD